ncbi:hypothetical protein Tco_1000685 [Tanacetum coccineum]
MVGHPSRNSTVFHDEILNAGHISGFRKIKTIGGVFQLSLSRLQSSILPFLDKLSPIVTVCSAYSGWIATLIPSVVVGSLGGRTFCVSTAILHSAGITMKLVETMLVQHFRGRTSIHVHGMDKVPFYFCFNHNWGFLSAIVSERRGRNFLVCEEALSDFFALLFVTSAGP